MGAREWVSGVELIGVGLKMVSVLRLIDVDERMRCVLLYHRLGMIVYCTIGNAGLSVEHAVANRFMNKCIVTARVISKFIIGINFQGKRRVRS